MTGQELLDHIVSVNDAFEDIATISAVICDLCSMPTKRLREKCTMLAGYMQGTARSQMLSLPKDNEGGSK